jgi:hypothetical protein
MTGRAAEAASVARSQWSLLSLVELTSLRASGGPSRGLVRLQTR